MDAQNAPSFSKPKSSKRPDSLKIELLTIPEDGSLATFGQNVDKLVDVSFRNITYSVRETFFRRRKFYLYT